MGRIVVRESEKEFIPVDYGKRKILVDPESASSKHVRVSITEYAPDRAHEMHRHPNQEEVIYIVDGEGISRTKDGDMPINTGAYVFIPADTDHATINVSKDRPMKAIIMKSPPYEGQRQ